MVEVLAGIGFPIVVLIQGAIFFQTKALNGKVDKMVTSDTCKERRGYCANKIKVFEKKMDHHEHNGAGVKYGPIT